jgi:transcriptional regulator with XRE-family HTH domain
VPSKPPPLPDRIATDLEALGHRIRSVRKAAGLAAASVAEAAGMSRVTVARIERGEPSVTMGAYLGVIAALGLDLRLVDPYSSDAAQPGAKTSTAQPDRICIADYPQLASVAWHVPGLVELTADEARGIYERHWRYLDPASIGPAEARLLARLGLADRLGLVLPA